MKDQVVHHVQSIGESRLTDCGIICNTGKVAITQWGEITCKKCIMEVNGDSQYNDFTQLGEKDE